MYYQYGQHCIFGAKFYPEIYKRGILFIGSPGTKKSCEYEKKIVDPSKTIPGQKICWIQKYFGSENFLDQKNTWLNFNPRSYQAEHFRPKSCWKFK